MQLAVLKLRNHREAGLNYPDAGTITTRLRRILRYKKRIIKYNEKGRGREGIVTPPYFKVHVI